MKKLFKVVLTVMMALTVTACSGGGKKDASAEVEGVVDDFFGYVAEADFDSLADIASEDVMSELGIEEMEEQLEMFDVETYGEVFVAEVEEFKQEIFANLFVDMEVTDTKVDSKTATATVTVKGQYLNYEDVEFDEDYLSQLAEEYVAENEDELMQIYTDEGMDAYIIAVYDGIAPILFDAMTESIYEVGTRDFDGVFNLENQDGEWIITGLE